MKFFLILLLLIYSHTARAQLNDEFSDGDFSSNPNWTGSNAGTDFTIVNNRLRSNSGIASSSFFLSTASTRSMNTLWEFWINIQFNPSGSNYVDVYLHSDKADLKSSAINGYFIRIGGTDDEISLFKRSGAASGSIKLIDGLNGVLNTSNNTLKIKLSRNTNGLFTLEHEKEGSSSGFYTEGTAVDTSFNNSAYFGILIQQSTSTFFQKHFFDNFRIGPLVQDNQAPEFKDITVLSEQSLEISFNEAMDSISAKNPANFILNNYQSTISAVSTTSDPAKFRLQLTLPLNTGNYTLKSLGTKDRAGNLIGLKDSINFNYLKPYLAKNGDIIINEIFADPSPQIDLPSVEFLELYNTSKESVSLKNWKISDPGSIGTLSDIRMPPESYLILCAKTDTAEFKKFGTVLGVSPWPSLNNSGDQLILKNHLGQTIDSVSYSDQWHRESVKKSGGWTLEKADPKSVCSGTFNWFSSRDSSGGSPGRVNSVFAQGYDQIELKADSLTINSDTTLTLHFNKYLNAATVQSKNFQLSPVLQIKEVKNIPDLRKCTLVLNTKFLPGTSYHITVKDLRDCSGNIIQNSGSLNFKTPELPKPLPEKTDTAKIYITEIFADPSPEIGLPLAEFIEIFNPGNDTTDLNNWSISDPQTKSVLKKAMLPPKEYLILCPAADTIHYKNFGKVLGLNPWPSLNNNSDQLALKSFKNRLSDSVVYTSEWYNNEVKKQGGWTLERIDFLSKCSGILNWNASINPDGGTPGKINSVHISNYDSIPFHADSISRTSDSTLTVYFNKPPDSSALRIWQFSLDAKEAYTIKSIKKISRQSISLSFGQKFNAGTEFNLKLQGLSDCSGNLISGKSEFSFRMPEIPKPAPERKDTAQIYITEIFADPSPEIELPLAEFIEIYNPGNDTVNLEGWSMGDSQTMTIFGKVLIQPRQYLIVCPEADTVHYKKFGNARGINPWPSLNNSSDQIILKSHKNRTVDSIYYHSSWYDNETKAKGGWTLERIDPESRCRGIFNWKASINQSGGTPGKLNSVAITNYDKMPFYADSLKGTSDSSITIYFNKAPDASALSNEKFILNPDAGPYFKILRGSDQSKLILNFRDKFRPGTEYLLKISNLSDCSGNLISGKSDFSFRTPDTPKPAPEKTDTARVYITEIFADPSPEIELPLAEFIEIYNPGKDTIDLNNWSLSDSQTKSSLKKAMLPPEEYLILCPIADTTYYKSFGKVLGLNPWPSLNNNSDQISLKSFKGRRVDSVSYSSEWYKDPVKKLGGWSLERSDFSENHCRGFYNWAASSDSRGGTPGQINSISRMKPLLKITDIQLISDSSFYVSFSTVPDTNYLKAENFSIADLLAKPRKLIIDPGYQRITLVFKENFKEGIRYELRADSLFSCSGQQIKGSDAKARFEIPLIAEKEYPVIINEIMADPDPVKGLPDAEYVELFNPTDNRINLEGLKFGSSYIFGRQELNAGSFLILCALADTSKLKKYGAVAGIKNWESLNNSNDALVLRNNKGREILKVEYKQSWYKNSEKQRGGYSLELIDVSSNCSGIQNWAASLDSLGGSPGRSNSHLQTPGTDEALKLTEIELIDSLSFIITLNKPIDSLKASNSENYFLNNGVGKASSALPVGSDFKKVKIGFDAELSRGINYTLSVENICDCRNKIITKEFSKIEIFYPKKIEKNNILITEILFNPKPGGSDFVEIYNNTDHPVDLKELSLGKSSGDNLSSVSKISQRQKLLEPGKYLALSPDPDNIRKEYYMENPDQILKMTGFPAFNDDSGTAIILSNEVTIDKLSYLEKMHFPLLKNVEGISLERRKLNLSAEEPGNLMSATTASGGATPGAQNSQYTAELADAEAFKLVSKTFSPDNDGFEDFMEMNYRFGESGNIANVSVFSDKGLLIKRILKNYLLNASGTFQWDGFDEYSQPAQTGIYILHAEIFNPEGAIKTFRRSFALVRKF